MILCDVKPILWIALAAALAAVVLVLPFDRSQAAPSEVSMGCAGGLAGARFADVYAAFAPLFALHESYAEYLFNGAGVSVPQDLSGACDRFPRALAELHLMSVTADSGVSRVPNEELVELQTEADAFCAVYRPVLEGIDEASVDEVAFLQEASDAGLFVRIHELNKRLDDLFEATFDGLTDDEARWCFAVAFTAHTMASRGSIDRIDEDLTAIFYGSAEATSVPFPVSAEVSEAMSGLIDLAGGRDLDTEEATRAGRWAAIIDAAFVPRSP